MDRKPVRMVCETCGSDNVMHDAWAVWNVATQEWELGATFDYAHCDRCEGETHIKEVPTKRRKMQVKFPPSATAVRFDEHIFWVDLEDGRTLGIPLAWFPRLLHGSPEQRDACSISLDGLHWDELDEDISIAGLLAGRGDMTKRRKTAA